MKRFVSMGIVLVLLLSLLSGCGASMEMDKADAPAAVAPMEENAMEMVTDSALGEDISSGNSGMELPSQQKLIRRIHMDAQTLSMDDLMSWLEGRVSELGGYFEQKSIRRSGSRDDGSYYRNADMVIRVPVDKLDAFVEQMGQNVNVVYLSEETENVTLTYIATQSRVEALETEQKRLLELLENAETMEDLLAIEARLTEVRSELQTYASQLRVLENQVSYSTIYLNAWEVDKPTVVTQRTVWQKIGDGFVENAGKMWDGLVNAFVWVLTAIPYLVPLALIAGVAWLAFKLGKKLKLGKKAKKASPETEQN